MQNRMQTNSFGSAAGGFAAGLILGAGIMALFDPQAGRTRRALTAQKAGRLARVAGKTIQGRSKDVSNRLTGFVAERRRDNDLPSDDVLEARVRSRLGRLVSHPGAIEVDTCDGCVILYGDILDHEADDLINEIESVPGVLQIEDQLDRFTDASHVPSLQGGRTRGRSRSGMIAGGMGGLFGLVAIGTLGYAAIRFLDVDLDDVLGASTFVTASGGDTLVCDTTDLESLERTGPLPDWAEHTEGITIDRRR